MVMLLKSGLDYSGDPFHKHVFLEHHLVAWCPPSGPIRCLALFTFSLDGVDYPLTQALHGACLCWSFKEFLHELCQESVDHHLVQGVFRERREQGDPGARRLLGGQTSPSVLLDAT